MRSLSRGVPGVLLLLSACVPPPCRCPEVVAAVVCPESATGAEFEPELATPGEDYEPMPDEDFERPQAPRVELEDAAGEEVGIRSAANGEFAIVLQLGERRMRARMSSRDLANAQTGNGAPFAHDLVTSAAGSLVLFHHNLDVVVDPPRFAESRWSEGWWFRAGLQSGEQAQAVRLRGEFYSHARVADDGSICITDARGTALNWVPTDAGLEESERDCPGRLAEQRGGGFEWIRGHWQTSEDFLQIFDEQRLARNLWALQVFWSDDGQIEDEGEQIPEVRSTRLLWRDESGQVHWYYLNVRGYCDATMVAGEIRCGTSGRFRFGDGSLVRQDSH